MITVTIKTILHFKDIFGAERTMTLPDAASLQDLLTAMAARWGEPFRSHVYHPGNATPENRVRLIINGRDIAFLDRLQTRLYDDDEVLIMPPIAGG